MLRSGTGFAIFGWALGFSACLALAASVELPPAPASMVQDDGRILGSATLEKVSRTLLDARRETGVLAYVVTTAFLDTSDAQKQMQQILDTWLRDEKGIVISCNRSNGQVGVAGSAGLWRHHPADEVARVLSETGRVLHQPGIPQETRIQDAVSVMASHLRRLPAVAAAGETLFTGIERMLAMMLAVVLALAGMLICLTSVVRRKRRGARDGPYFFPEATASPRLGAQFGATAGEASVSKTAPSAK